MTDALYRLERREADRTEPFLAYRSKRDWRPEPEPLDSELAMYLTFLPVVAEFQSDPTSVQCFDLRIVKQAIWIVEKFEGRFGGWMEKHPDEVRRVRGLLAGATIE